MILSFSEGDPDAVYLDAATGGLYIEKPEDTARYTWIFDHVRAGNQPGRLVCVPADHAANPDLSDLVRVLV